MDLENGGLLGEGSYGKVYQAIDRITRRQVAIKEVNRDRLGSEERRLMNQEIELCQVLNEDEHIGLVQLYDVYEDTT
jgi:serine/threonine protein kinase